MEKTNFENLEIYRLAEILADEVWAIVIRWNRLAQDTIGTRQYVACPRGDVPQIADRGRHHIETRREFSFRAGSASFPLVEPA